MKRTIIALFFIAYALSSHAQKASGTIPTGSLVYALPQTTVEVKVEIIKELFIPGPYAGYADAYLSVDRVPMFESVKYSLQSVEMSQVISADYESVYAIPASYAKGSTFFSLSSEGLIFTGENDIKEFKSVVGVPSKNFQFFPDRLPSSPIETKKTSTYDRVKTDSGFIHIPYKQSIVNEKDPERKAEEAAKFIFALRQRRFELITGDVDNAFAGSSLKDALNEINRLENEYMSLFIAKSFTQSRIHTFYVTPDKTNNKSSYNVFRLSENEGVLNSSSRGGKLFTLEVSPSGKSKVLDHINFDGGRSGVIYYRVPETASVQLFEDGKEICSGTMKLYQTGKDLAISADILTK